MGPHELMMMRQMMPPLKALLCLGLLSAERADAHGAVTHPRPRNAIDGNQAPWGGKVPWPIPFGAAPSSILPPSAPSLPLYPLRIATAAQRARARRLFLCGRQAKLVRAPVGGHGGQGQAQSHGIERSGV